MKTQTTHTPTPLTRGLPELWIVKKFAVENGISIQIALTLIRKAAIAAAEAR